MLKLIFTSQIVCGCPHGGNLTYLRKARAGGVGGEMSGKPSLKSAEFFPSRRCEFEHTTDALACRRPKSFTTHWSDKTIAQSRSFNSSRLFQLHRLKSCIRPKQQQQQQKKGNFILQISQ
ncbi:hypothetical protein PoB_003640600 [Plakobranchus ocellatus]|uniref:Uncharacterized protein n=1 Tax=Plakobranchus ocellatus TaxID=259542 RepID=A0AAV4ATL4_9GAST|nr:hypothetical protein PoB_003640600 [Plakobranchus ocellatus]